MLAIALARRDFREMDQIVSLYSQDRGKIEALARGVKKITSKNSSFLESGSLVEAEIIVGKEIVHLGRVQAINSYPGARSDWRKILLLGHSFALADRLLRVGERDERIFALLRDWLDYLAVKQPVNLFLASVFAVKLSKLLGVSPRLGACIHCARTRPVAFDYAEGGVLCAACFGNDGHKAEKFGAGEWSDLRRLWSGDWRVAELIINSKVFEISHRFIAYHHEREFAYLHFI